jgi:protein-disulfide isomerase
MSVSRRSLGVLAVLSVSLPAAGPAAAQEIGFAAAQRYRVALDDAPSRGPRDAIVTIVEFSDFNCRFCRIGNQTVIELLRLYPRDVRLVFRHSLLDPEDGTLAAEAAMAAAEQGRFWPYHDQLFASGGGFDRATLERHAREVGLDMDRFRRDLGSRRFRSEVRDQDRRAGEFGVSATPVFFVNGRPLGGAHALGTFLALIEEERAAAEALVARGVARPDVYHRITARGLARAQPMPAGADMPDIPRLDESAIYPVGLGARSHQRGPDQALVTIVEFSDFLCGFCGRAQPVLRELEQQYGPDLRLAYRHMPLGNRPESRLIAEAALAAGEQGRFWDMHDRLFASEAELDRPRLEGIARELGLDMKRFRAALDGHRFALEVSADAAVAARLGVRGTPTFFINGTPLVGARSADEFRAVIDGKLAEARALLKKGVPRADIYRTVTGQRSRSR